MNDAGNQRLPLVYDTEWVGLDDQEVRFFRNRVFAQEPQRGDRTKRFGLDTNCLGNGVALGRGQTMDLAGVRVWSDSEALRDWLAANASVQVDLRMGQRLAAVCAAAAIFASNSGQCYRIPTHNCRGNQTPEGAFRLEEYDELVASLELRGTPPPGFVRVELVGASPSTLDSARIDAVAGLAISAKEAAFGLADRLHALETAKAIDLERADGMINVVTLIHLRLDALEAENVLDRVLALERAARALPALAPPPVLSCPLCKTTFPSATARDAHRSAWARDGACPTPKRPSWLASVRAAVNGRGRPTGATTTPRYCMSVAAAAVLLILGPTMATLFWAMPELERLLPDLLAAFR